MSSTTVGIESTTIDVKTADGIADSYLSQPVGSTPRPGVLMLMDIFGLRPRIYEIADRIAREGYVVLAPNVFYRAGRAPLWEPPDSTSEEAHDNFVSRTRPLRDQLTLDALRADGDAYLSALEQRSKGPIGITGYCLGGQLGWKIVASHPARVAVLAGFHTSRLVSDGESSPHLLASQITAEVYWGHADGDPGMTPDQIAKLDQAMADADISYRTEIYEGAGHGYTMSDEPTWNPEACERHFQTLFELFGRVLKP